MHVTGYPVGTDDGVKAFHGESVESVHMPFRDLSRGRCYRRQGEKQGGEHDRF